MKGQGPSTAKTESHVVDCFMKASSQAFLCLNQPSQQNHHQKSACKSGLKTGFNNGSLAIWEKAAKKKNNNLRCRLGTGHHIKDMDQTWYLSVQFHVCNCKTLTSSIYTTSQEHDKWQCSSTLLLAKSAVSDCTGTEDLHLQTPEEVKMMALFWSPRQTAEFTHASSGRP